VAALAEEAEAGLERNRRMKIQVRAEKGEKGIVCLTLIRPIYSSVRPRHR
jgi:hypothetical protein